MYKVYAKLRDARGLTDYEVATKTGIPQSSIYDWKQRSQKNEGASMSITSLQKIASLFEVSLLELVGK
ncbi:MAG: helix-turn-helix transcriptional regulator [Oscillospiraceae bacterium]|nr:helix-turn-helix transcriptional regulator [Oscillospiraceae bacterium]